MWRGGGGGGGGPRSRSPPDDRLSKRQRRARSRSRSPGGDGEGGALRHFQEHSAKPGFKKLHHPERVAEELLAFREAGNAAEKKANSFSATAPEQLLRVPRAVRGVQ